MSLSPNREFYQTNTIEQKEYIAKLLLRCYIYY